MNRVRDAALWFVEVPAILRNEQQWLIENRFIHEPVVGGRDKLDPACLAAKLVS
jgi:hypothetical protein